MEPSTLSLGVLDGQAAAEQTTDAAVSEVPTPLKSLSLEEERIWVRVAADLQRYGLIHRTDAMVMHMIVKTYVQWVQVEAEVEKHVADNGSIMIKVGENGYEQPHPAVYVARSLKGELLKLLPEACLTIPSFAKVKQAMREPQQADMFDPLVAFVSGKPQPPRLVSSR